ncbi:MAG: hypothetical protein R6V36_08065 [Psychroflexus sp.]
MGFFQSAINQVGRDLGRVASNAIFKNKHSIPIRHVKNNTSNRTSPSTTRKIQHQGKLTDVKSEFEKSLNFTLGYRPPTLISKIAGAYAILKNEALAFVEDGYLDEEESELLFNMLRQFNAKIADIDDVLGFTVDEDDKVFDQLKKIVEAMQSTFVDVLKISEKACVQRAKIYKEKAQEVEPLTFGRYFGLHLIWMGKYARGGEKNTGQAVLANILDIITCTFLITRFVLAVKALVSFKDDAKKREDLKIAYEEAASSELERAETYEIIINKNKSSNPDS